MIKSALASLASGLTVFVDVQAFDTFSCATEAAIICLEILTSKGIARELMLSDVTDRIVRFMQ